MALKETLDVIAAFGYVAGILTAVKLAREVWQVVRSSKIKNAYSPELRDQMERNNKTSDKLRLRVAAFLGRERAPA